ncbi:epoxide hydrolase family protein [Leifsonia sp. NPDC058194]|uniref:epoxide hydrolase family protein n=1 Tax=Leifsonia sp. NPDC058194 TaxID=3346374 RepID=UPI0036D94F89
MEDFRIHVTDDELADLDHRLDAAILPEARPGADASDWSAGIPPAVLADLVEYWRTVYDWRAVERRLNASEQHTAEIDCCRIHFARVGEHRPGRLPIVLTHGWPYTFAAMLPLADALREELEVVVPSLPGYGFSAPLPGLYGSRAAAERWHTLMTQVLGHDRYLVYGEDVGAELSDWLAAAHPEAVAGIIASHASFSARERPGVELDDAERAFLASVATPAESGYAHAQGTRPDTLAAALLDSPAGLLDWITEKVARWSDGTALERFDVDDVLTNAMLYWVSRSIGTSFRPYSDDATDPVHPLIAVPASILIQTHEAAYPRSLAEKTYTDIRSFARLDRGGHFTAWEAPEAVAAAVLALEEQVRG